MHFIEPCRSDLPSPGTIEMPSDRLRAALRQRLTETRPGLASETDLEPRVWASSTVHRKS